MCPASMAQEFSDKVLILKVGKFREVDMWVRYLSPTRGIDSAFAFGGAVSRRRFMGCLDALNLVMFTIGRGKGDSLNLKEGTLLEGFREIKEDAALLGPAVNCLKFLEAAQVGVSWSRQAFNLTMDALAHLASGPKKPNLLPLLFRVRATFEQGYEPDLERCASCGGSLERIPSKVLFSVEKGMLFCSSHCPDSGALPLSRGAVKTLSWIKNAPPGRWTGVNVEGSIRREVADFIDRFSAWHLGLAADEGGYKKV